MKILLNIEVVVIGAIIAQGFFAGLILPFFRNNHNANRILAILVMLFSLWLCDTFFRVSGIFDQYSNFYFIPIYYSLAFGPLIYFYTKALTENKFSLNNKHLLHFIPVILQMCFYTFLQTQGNEFRIWFWQEIHQPYTYNLEFILSFLSFLFYLILSLKSLQSYQKWIKNNYSDISKIKLNWLRYTHLLIMVLITFWVFDALIRLFTDYDFDKPLSSMSIGFTIIFLAMGSLTQTDLKDIVKETSVIPPNTNIEEALDFSLITKIEQAMKEEKMYLKSELTLKEFAQSLGASTRKISRHINFGLNLPFIDFVNHYRVAHVKDLIEQGKTKQLSLVGIAMESGFNSKSTFNRVFKKLTGNSPSEYQKMVQNEL